ncbi:MAG: extracellular solute-binding protein [Firmicutes bacterium]|nr:extracellular solute-binding protein [Bacillota bacterium]
MTKRARTIGYAVIVAVVLTVLLGAAAAVAAEKVTIRVALGWRSATLMAVEKEIATEFEKNHPGIDIALEAGDHLGKWPMMLAAGTMPDVGNFDARSLPLWVSKDVMLDLDQFIKKDTKFDYADFVPEANAPYRIGGKLYGIVAAGVQTSAMAFNKTLFKNAGLPPPGLRMSWSTFRDAARKLTKRDSQGRLTQLGVNANIWAWPWVYVIRGPTAVSSSMRTTRSLS